MPDDIAEALGRIFTRLDQQDRDLADIKRMVRATNGRVTALEAARIETNARLDERRKLDAEHIARSRHWQSNRATRLLVVATVIAGAFSGIAGLITALVHP